MEEMKVSQPRPSRSGRTVRGLGLLLGALAPATLLAHPADVPLAAFSAGISHPWAGADHLLAMLLVGLWAAQRGGQARWISPLLFVSVMAAGCLFAWLWPVVATVDQLTLLTVLALGTLVALSARLPPAFAGLLIALFAFAHGYAHGLETPAQARFSFAIGFAASTLTLHLCGILIASALLKHNQTTLLRAAGASAAAAGVALMLT